MHIYRQTLSFHDIELLLKNEKRSSLPYSRGRFLSSEHFIHRRIFPIVVHNSKNIQKNWDFQFYLESVLDEL